MRHLTEVWINKRSGKSALCFSLEVATIAVRGAESGTRKRCRCVRGVRVLKVLRPLVSRFVFVTELDDDQRDDAVPSLPTGTAFDGNLLEKCARFYT